MIQGFYKYHGTGNDFVMIDDRRDVFAQDADGIQRLASRRYGIGADGLILLRESAQADFKMVYFNADGRQSTFCGNGSRCAVAFAARLGMIGGDACTFEAVDGIHHAKLLAHNMVSVRMSDTKTPKRVDDYWILDTGSPHCVVELGDLASVDVDAEGRRIRHLEQFEPGGVNVNFVTLSDSQVKIRTYERGVEAETHSCGTGVTAAALVWASRYDGAEVEVMTQGGQLMVGFRQKEGGFEDIWLTGPAEMVYYGHITYEGSKA